MAEVLSQSQIDALLNSLSGGGDEPEANTGDSTPATSVAAGTAAVDDFEKTKKDKKYDFYAPKKFTKDRLKLLKSIFDNYSRIASSQMNSLYRVSSEVEVLTAEEQRYYEFSNALGETDVITLINTTLPDYSKNPPIILHISPSIALSMIDRMLGGNGTNLPDNITSYTYTDIELVLYRRVVKYLIPILKDTWAGHIRIGFDFDRVEENPSMFSGVSVDETIVIIALNVDMGNDINGQITLCFPGGLLSSIFSIMDKNKMISLDNEDNKDLTRAEIMDSIKESILDVSARLGQVEVNLSDIYSLQEGDIINLFKPKDSLVDVYVDRQHWFAGKLGVMNKNLAVEIDQVLVKENILKDLMGIG